MTDPQVQEIKERLDMFEIARSYLGNFKKSGANYFFLCPFHNEKTPSFSVNSELGIYKCFGCGQSGDVISFIKEMEGVDFPKALEIAAKKAGVTLKRRFSPQDAKIHQERQDILALNSLVSEYYHYILKKHTQGQKGREYAKERKVTGELVDKFSIGYAPHSYTNLLSFLEKKGYKKADLIKWGVIVAGGGHIYDKFRSRLIFPLINQHGDIVGFSGRTIYKDTKAPKYLHSPQTLVFDKSSFLFGIEQAKQEIRKKDFVVFCEGQLDVISSHKTKVRNIVASLGTSLNPRQLQLAKRYTKNIYFCFDTDLAGETALLRSVTLAHIEGLEVKAVTLPEGKDADELINKDKEEWEKVVKNAEPIVDHMIARLNARLDLSKLAGKEEFASIILPIISELPKKLEQMYYIQKVSVILNVSEDVLKEEVVELQKTAAAVKKVDVNKIKKILESPINVKEEYLLALLLQHTQFLGDALGIAKPRYITTPASKTLLKKLKVYYEKSKKFTLKNFIANLESHEQAFIENLLLKKLDAYFEIKEELLQEAEKIVKHLRENYHRAKLKKIKVAVEEAENADDKELVEKLLKELIEVSDRLQES